MKRLQQSSEAALKSQCSTVSKHADGFIDLIRDIARDAGLSDPGISTSLRKNWKLPGHFRPSKSWDIVISSETELLAVIEFKSQVGSFGNNYNNRVEEALGNALDFHTAYRKGMFKPSSKPWLGYLFILEEDTASNRKQKHKMLFPFQMDNEFQELSYIQRYELTCLRFLRESCYDAACFITSNSAEGLKGGYCEPNPELSLMKFAISLHSRISAYVKFNVNS